MYKKVSNCRACGTGHTILPSGIKAQAQANKLTPVFDLGVQPLANDFTPPEGEHQGYAPLKVLVCPKCGLAQLSVVVRPEILYGGSYLYVTSKTTMMMDHFERLLRDSMNMAKDARTVLEIGSNDGDFLKFCKDHWMEQVIGIEPSENLSQAANVNGIRTFCDFFNEDSARMVKETMPDVGLVFARHVFCHVDDWKSFMVNLATVANDNTLIVIEAPYVVDQLTENSFDQIYHEHLSYLSLRAFQALLDFGPFQLQTVRRYPIHGGVIALFIRRKTSNIPPDKDLETMIKSEECGPDVWRSFSLRAQDCITNLRLYVRNLREQGKRVVGFGASAKSTVWINACGFGPRDLEAVYDCTREKWYRFVPGTEIPVVNQGSFYADAPDYAIMFAWNYAAEILHRQQKWMEGGGKFIVPLPHLRVIGIDSDTGKA